MENIKVKSLELDPDFNLKEEEGGSSSISSDSESDVEKKKQLKSSKIVKTTIVECKLFQKYFVYIIMYGFFALSSCCQNMKNFEESFLLLNMRNALNMDILFTNFNERLIIAK